MKAKEYGLYNNIKKEFQFGIKEKSRKEARKKALIKLKKDFHKWRFEIKEIKSDSKTQGA